MKSAFMIAISLCPVVIALIELYKKKKAQQLLQTLGRLFDRLGRMIFSVPTEAIVNFDALMSAEVLPMFCRSICDSLMVGDSFSDAWNTALAKLDSFCFLSNSIKNSLSAFGYEFGLGTVDYQVRLCEKYEDLCNAETQRIKKEMENNSKLYISGSILAGAFLFIIMI